MPLRVALISLWKGLEGERRSSFRKGSSADPPPVQQYKDEGQAISGEELALVATSASQEEQQGVWVRWSCPGGLGVSRSDCSRLLTLSSWGMPHFQHYYLLS